MATISFDEFVKRTGGTAKTVTTSTPAPQTKPGYFSEGGQDLKQIGTDISSSFAKRREAVQAGKASDQSGLSTFGQTLGQGAGLVSDVFGSAVKGIAKAVLPQGAEDAIKNTAVSALKPVVESQPFKDLMAKYDTLDDKTKRDVDAIMGVVSLASDVVGGGAAGAGAKVGTKAAVTVGKKGIALAEDVAEVGARATKKLVEKVQAPKPTPLQAVGQVIQGETGDIKAGVKSLTSLDTKGVKTFADLDTKINEKITTLAQKVDTDLGSDTTKTALKDLTVTGTTKGGAKVATRPVEDALNQLEELYAVTGDKVMEANIRELKAIAKTQGLTKQEVNDIARTYGQEFGKKAFGKTGEPLTSINAQRFENTRKGVKAVARKGITGKEAQKADALMSNLYDTQRLVQKNVEAVNKLQQRIRERGLLEKFGHAIAKYGDIVTGGTIRGIVGGLLPRGAGYKVLNALDLQDLLADNLKIIQRAIETGSEEDILRLLKNIK